MKKQLHTDYYDIVRKELENFAAAMGITAPAFFTDASTDESRATLHFDSFDATVYFGDMMPYGYTFLEDVHDDIAEYCLLTRFKFNFAKTHFSPYDIHNVIGCNDFRTLDFHLIRNETALRKSLDVILGFIKTNLNAISNISYDLNRQRRLIQNYEYDMHVVSPKISAFDLKDDFKKYTEKHESRFHGFGDAVSMIRFVGAGKSDALKKYFKKAEKKGKLITFEKRYRDYLEARNYQVPLGDFAIEVKAETKRSKKIVIVNVATVVFALMATAFLMIIVEVIADEGVFADKLLVSSGNSRGLAFMAVFISIWHLCRDTVKKIVCGGRCSSGKSKSEKQLAVLILTVIEIIVIIGGSIYHYYFGYKPVLISDAGIYYGSVSKGENYPYDTKDIEFFYIDGYVDHYEEAITKDDESAALYVVYKDNYIDYCVDAFETKEEREQALEKLKENGVKIKVISTYEEYDRLFVSD